MGEDLSNRALASTHWSVVLLAGSDDAAGAREALEVLCRTYWRPLFAYACRLGSNEEEAKDLTQAFFQHFLEKGYIRAADPERGRFRSFLLTAFRHFSVNDVARKRAAKRGGQRSFLTLDEFAAAAKKEEPHSAGVSPDQYYDQQWALTVMQRAMQVLKAEYDSEGKDRSFQILKPFLAASPAEGDYENAAAQLQVRSANVALQVHRMRDRYKAAVRAEVAQTVGKPEDLEDELRYLVSLIAR